MHDRFTRFDPGDLRGSDEGGRAAALLHFLTRRFDGCRNIRRRQERRYMRLNIAGNS
jgi:hypothetical protein